MTIEQFLEILADNRDLLSIDGTIAEGGMLGCPLWVAIHTGCCPMMQAKSIWVNGTPCNPDPDDAAFYLNLDPVFTKAVSDAWDMGVFYEDAEANDDWRLQFAGYLVGITLRPSDWKPYHHELPSGAP